MNVWDIVLAFIGWLVLVVLVITAMLVIAGLLLYIWKETRKLRAKRKPQRIRLSDPVTLAITAKLTDEADRRYPETLLAPENEGLAEAFIAGGMFALSVKQGTDADRV